MECFGLSVSQRCVMYVRVGGRDFPSGRTGIVNGCGYCTHVHIYLARHGQLVYEGSGESQAVRQAGGREGGREAGRDANYTAKHIFLSQQLSLCFTQYCPHRNNVHRITERAKENNFLISEKLSMT